MITALSLSPAVDKIYFVDNFEPGKLFRVDNSIRSAGGKGINVARVAAILGEKVSLLGFKAGNTGEWLENEVKKLGAYTAFIPVEGESRTNNNIIDRVNHTETEVLESGPCIMDEDAEAFLQVFESVLCVTDVLICSGGLPVGIPDDFYRRLIEIAKPYGVKVILDTSGDMLREGIKAKPHVIKPNLRELSQYAGRLLTSQEEIAAASRMILDEGIDTVVASLGEAGALMVSRGCVLRTQAPELEAVNTIGSGDSMVAGLAAGMQRGYSPVETLRLGMACAAANTQFMEIGHVTPGLVEKYLGEIVIDSIYR